MRIDLFHDTACPWCRIGKAYLKQTLEQWDGESIEVYYHTFFLNPNIPDEGYSFREYMQAKGGGRVSLEQWFDAPRRMGEQAGIIFNFEKIDRAPNTLLSHQLIALAPPDKQEVVIDAVYKAYFQDGLDIGDLDVLVGIAKDNGLDTATIRQQLEQGEKRNEVLADARMGQQIGVTSVPFFIVNQKLAFSGAQAPEVILDVMRQAQSEIEQA